jgi:hemolysin III
MTRTKLVDRRLPDYTRGEEIFNMVSHIAGGGIGIIALVLCVVYSAIKGDPWAVVSCALYGASLVFMYSVSSVYHGLRTNKSKKVMQIIDHCTIYFLIAGTYTPIMLVSFLPVYPGIGWALLLGQWALCFLAATLTAIDLKAYNAFSMVCYIAMGWGIIFFIPQCIRVLGMAGFYWLLAGGIAYTIGAALYGLGSKKKWLHSVFHIFVVLGSFLQFIAIYFFAII